MSTVLIPRSPFSINPLFLPILPFKDPGWGTAGKRDLPNPSRPEMRGCFGFSWNSPMNIPRFDTTRNFKMSGRPGFKTHFLACPAQPMEYLREHQRTGEEIKPSRTMENPWKKFQNGKDHGRTHFPRGQDECTDMGRNKLLFFHLSRLFFVFLRPLLSPQTVFYPKNPFFLQDIQAAVGSSRRPEQIWSWNKFEQPF